ncbi:MAG: hypothetical protein JW795_08090 [Chitinivibrionales bacterium]|nr:hypothetical protein [Chitinivibrionales bacterium]
MQDSTKRKNDFIFYLESLRYSFRMAEIVNQRLDHDLAELEIAYEKKSETSHLSFTALLDAWSMIDNIFRIKELADQIPLIRKKDRLFFLKKIGDDAEYFRHYIQHLRNEINTLPIQTNPLWGGLSWVSKSNAKRQYRIMPSTVANRQTYLNGISLDQENNSFTMEVCLEAGQRCIDLKKAYSNIILFEQFTEEWVKNNSTIGNKCNPILLQIDMNSSRDI